MGTARRALPLNFAMARERGHGENRPKHAKKIAKVR
jgi:hypothetical protein